jgi:hypothetical protein
MVIRAMLLALIYSSAQANEVTLSSLVVGENAYTNVTVLSVTATDIYFSHNRGVGNAKLSELEPALQQRFHFNPEKAAAQVARQHQSNVMYFQSLTNALAAEKHMEPVFPELVTRVEAAPPIVDYDCYSMAGTRPAHLRPKALANTRCTFNCDPQITWHPISRKAEHGFKWRIAEVKFALSLPIKITLPEGATARTKAHEEGHRKIHEHFYAKYTDVARQLGEALRERDFISFESKLSKVEEKLTVQAKGIIQVSYYQQAIEPSRRANNYYDEITENGRNGTDPNEAVAKAIARYEPQIPVTFNFPTVTSVKTSGGAE